MLKMIATSGFLAALECTKFVLGLGSAPDPAACLQCSPDPLAGYMGPTSKGDGEREGIREGKTGTGSLTQIPGFAPDNSTWEEYVW